MPSSKLIEYKFSILPSVSPALKTVIELSVLVLTAIILVSVVNVTVVAVNDSPSTVDTVAVVVLTVKVAV